VCPAGEKGLKEEGLQATKVNEDSATTPCKKKTEVFITLDESPEKDKGDRGCPAEVVTKVDFKSPKHKDPADAKDPVTDNFKSPKLKEPTDDSKSPRTPVLLWTAAEDLALIELVDRYTGPNGTKQWSPIFAQFHKGGSDLGLPPRSTNAIKSHWYSDLKKKILSDKDKDKEGLKGAGTNGVVDGRSPPTPAATKGSGSKRQHAPDESDSDDDDVPLVQKLFQEDPLLKVQVQKSQRNKRRESGRRPPPSKSGEGAESATTSTGSPPPREREDTDMELEARPATNKRKRALSPSPAALGGVDPTSCDDDKDDVAGAVASVCPPASAPTASSAASENAHDEDMVAGTAAAAAVTAQATDAVMSGNVEPDARGDSSKASDSGGRKACDPVNMESAAVATTATTTQPPPIAEDAGISNVDTSISGGTGAWEAGMPLGLHPDVALWLPSCTEGMAPANLRWCFDRVWNGVLEGMGWTRGFAAGNFNYSPKVEGGGRGGQ
jgi:hypothetical protein